MLGDRCFKCGAMEGDTFQPTLYGKRRNDRINRRVIIVHHHTKYGDSEHVEKCCKSCHQKLHRSLRLNGICKLSVRELSKLSDNSYNKDLKHIQFEDTVGKNVILRERIRLSRTGNVNVTITFKGDHGKRLKRINGVLS